MPDATLVETPARAPVDNDILYEVIDGRIVEKPVMGIYQVLVASELIRLMNTSAGMDRLGRVVSEMLFVVDPTRKLKRRPDVAFVSYERWPRRSPSPTGDALEVVPDLAVEVISPSNTADEVVDKLDEYFRAGGRLVWVIYPVSRKIYVYTSPIAVRILQPGDDLDGGPVIPGFRVPVKSLFDEDD